MSECGQSMTPITDRCVLGWSQFADEGYGESPYVYAEDMRKLESSLAEAVAALKGAEEFTLHGSNCAYWDTDGLKSDEAVCDCWKKAARAIIAKHSG